MSLAKQLRAHPCFIVPTKPSAGEEQAHLVPLETLIRETYAESGRVVVVGLLGRCPRTKARVANALVDHPAFMPVGNLQMWKQHLPHPACQWVPQMSGVEVFYDKTQGVLYLNAASALEDVSGLELCKSLSRLPIGPGDCNGGNMKAHRLLQRMESAKFKLWLYTFLASHLVLWVHDRPRFDVDQLRLLHEVANYKQELARAEGGAAWTRSSELGTLPTLVLLFDATSLAQSAEGERGGHRSRQEGVTPRGATNASRKYCFAELEKSLEQQVRAVFRRGKSEAALSQLCQLESTQLVRVMVLGESGEEGALRVVASPETVLKEARRVTEEVNVETWASGDASAVAALRKYCAAKVRTWHAGDEACWRRGEASNERGGVTRDPVVDLSLASSPDVSPPTRLPSARAWLELSQTLLERLWQPYASSLPLSGSLHADFLFSSDCCRHALAAARRVYFSRLPAMYTSSFHNRRTQLATRVFRSLARGPLSSATEASLLQECLEHWHAGHCRCDAVSLTGRPCVHVAHDAHAYGGSALVGRPHSSNAVLQQACNCGRTVAVRDDPFDLLAANTTFHFGAPCCARLESLLAAQLATKNRAIAAPTALNLEEPEADARFSKFLTTPQELGWDILVWGNPSDVLVASSPSGDSTEPQQRVYSFSGLTNLSPDYSQLLPLRSPASSPLDATAHLGYEYECISGHRWFLNARSLSTQLGLRELVVDNVDLPIYVKCTGCSLSAQLQRIYACVLPAFPLQITFKPTIRIYAPSPDDHADLRYLTLGLGLEEPVSLPLGRVTCVRLPYIYSLKGKPLVHEALTNHASCRFYLQARSLRCSPVNPDER